MSSTNDNWERLEHLWLLGELSRSPSSDAGEVVLSVSSNNLDLESISESPPPQVPPANPSGSQAMQIPPIWFFSFWVLISITFLHVGFYALDKTELSGSISPVVMSFFKHSLAICSCCSANYALMFRLQKEYFIDGSLFALYPVVYCAENTSSRWVSPLRDLFIFLSPFLSRRLYCLPNMSSFARWYFVIMTFLPSLWFPQYYLIFFLINFIFLGGHGFTCKQKIGIGIHLVAETSLFFVTTGKNTKFFPILVLFTSFSISAFWFMKLLAFAAMVNKVVSFLKMENKGVKVIEFAVGMMGAILFQNFFRLTSFDEVLAFLYLAVMWVANLALLGFSNDFGVLNFLLGNVVVGTTVNQFELRIKTWFAFGFSFLLYVLHILLQSSSLVYERPPERQAPSRVDSQGPPRGRLSV